MAGEIQDPSGTQEEIERLKHPTPEDLRQDPEWAVLLDQGFEFKDQSSVVQEGETSLSALSSQQRFILAGRSYSIDEINANIVAEDFRQRGYEVRFAPAYEYGNPVSGKLIRKTVAIFVKKRE